MKFSDIKIIKWLIGLPMKTKIISAVVAGTIAVGSGVGIGIAVNNSNEPEHTHSYTQQTTTEATCTTKGVITYICSCNDTYTEEILVLGHDEKTHEAQAPTCTEIGWNEYVTCEREGCDYSTYEELSATGSHTWNDGEITKEPTCTETGVKTFTCTVCQTATYTEDVNALEHDTKTYQAQDPTCTEIGWNEYVTCERDGCDYSTYEELPALKHDEKTHEAKASTCTEIGWNEYVTCERDGCDYSTYEELPALKHDEKIHKAQAPTCTEIGWNEYVTCERDGCDYSTYEELPATGIHTWDNGTETKTPTCTKEGETTYLCMVCKKITKTEPIETLPHEHAKEWSYNETHHYHECKCGDKADETKHSPSAPATATTKQTCTICGYVIQEETGILFNTLSVNDTKVYGKVSNATTEFSFINEVLIKGNATYVVDNDKDCNSPIASKTVDLNIGDNVFYVLESAGNNVKLYTVTIRRRPMYDVTFNTNGGTAVEKQIVEEDSFAVEPKVSKQGYTLAGWDYDFTLPITKNTHITAIWDADNGTKYTVNYYLQNIDDDNYTLYETDELKGITNTTIEAVVKVYQHFTYNEAKSTVEGIVKPDGSLVLSVYYTRNSYTIQVGTEIVNVGSEITQTGGVRYGVEVICTTSLTDGYTFLGWYDGVNLVSTDIEFVFIAEKDVIYMAKWQANDDTKYIVNYYCQNIENDEYTLYDTKEFTGTTDTTAAATVYEYDHFTYNESISTVSGNIHGDGSLVLSVYYTRNKYTVQAGYYLENVSSSITQIETWKYGSECTASVTLIDGYTWLGWYEYDGSELQFVNDNLSFIFTVEKDVTYYQCWKLNEDTKYTVNYYLQNVNNNEYTLYKTEELTGTTDTLATAEIKQYPHFTYKESISTISDYIKGDGSLVLSVYYTRDSYTVTTSGNNTKAGTYKQINGKYRYDKEITLTATTNAGYTFLGWYEGEVLACRTTEFTFKAERNVTYTAKWQANDNTRYTVKYYLQNLDNNEYTLKETANLTGTTDSVVTATIKEYDHYIHNANISVISGNVKGDNSLVLSVYYTRATYDIVVNGNSARAGTYTQINGNYRYGKELTLTATTNAGYTWLGWYEGETLVSETAEFTFKVEKDVTYTAKWYTLNDTKYTVKYYLQNINDDNYTLQETVELMDTVDTTATATIKTYPHFTYNVSKSTISGNIHGDGSLVLSVYYTRDNYTVNTSGNNTKAGMYTQLNDTYRFDKEITLSATINAGYTFLGWYDGDLLVGQNLSFTFNVEKDVTYTAKWQANEDTKYKVNYYWQNIDNDEYTLKETVELTGMTDTTATAEIKTYSHFTYNAGASTISGNINGDGSQILKVYYTRANYTVTANRNNTKAGTITGGGSYSYDKQITLTATTNAGYTFLGWYEGENLVCETVNFTFKVQKNTTYTAKWQANTDTKYNVNYYLQNVDNNEYTLYESNELKGETNTIVTATVKEYEHFTYKASASVISGTINGDGSLVLNVYYTRDTYTIATEINNAKAGTVNQGGMYRFDKQITLTATTNAGYTFLGWHEGDVCVCATETFTFNVDGNSTYTAKWQANDDTMYVVNYYLQTLEGGYAMHQATPLTGTTDTTANAEIKEYEHFTYNASKSTVSGNINGDGSLVLNVYYTRNSYTISAIADNTKAGTISGAGSYRFDKQITLTATTNAGYTFLGWYEGENPITQTAELTFNVEKDVTYTAKWTANTDTKYTVNYYWQNVEDDEYSLHETVELTGITDTTATAEIKEYTHFAYNASKSTISGNINGDGSRVLIVYYTRNTYTLSINDSSIGSITNAGTYRYGKAITTTATSLYFVYEFIGWYSDEELLSTDLTYMFTIEKDVIAKFKMKEEMSNFNFTYTDTTCSITGIKDKTVTEIIVPDYVTSIGFEAFYNCSSLTSVTIGDSVTSIGSLAFLGCFRIVEVVNKSTHITVVKGSLSNGYVGTYALAVYNSGDTFESTKLSTDNEYIVYTDGEEKILVAYTGTESDLTLPTYITKINQYAFYNCQSLTSVTIGNSVTSIGDYAFEKCYQLVEVVNRSPHITVVKGDSLNGYLGYYALVVYNSGDTFESTKLSTDKEYIIYTDGEEKILVAYTGTESDLTLPIYITKINQYAFYNCQSLTSVTIGNSVTSIGYAAFKSCSNLAEITLPFVGASKNGTTNSHFGYIFGATSYSDNSSSIPSSLKKVTITSALFISEFAFSNCGYLKEIIIPDSVTSIGKGAFYECTSLTSITLPFVGASRQASREYGVLGFIFGFVEETSSNQYNRRSSYDKADPSLEGIYCSSGIIDYYGDDIYADSGVWQYSRTADEVSYVGYYTRPEPHYAYYYYKHAFYYHIPSSLKNVTITDANKLSTGAFQNCTNLESIIINSNAKSNVETDVFRNCSATVTYN